MGLRRTARERALQIMYQFDMTDEMNREAFRLFWEENEEKEEIKKFAENLFKNTRKRLSEIDGVISKHADNWAIERMAIVDRNILRIATYEILYAKDIPSRVAIDEAIEIAKRFGTKDSPRFVNGVLDKIMHEENKEEK